ncbi:MAG: SprT family zinc-dependent metalloprotease [Clostridia bacterium]|nr:SprT family zinc-dependent metalloprotease [Clostridia bacterium]
MTRTVTALGITVNYELIKTDRRDMSLKVTKDDVRLFAPKFSRLKPCDDFVKRQAEWIAGVQKRLKDYNRQYEDAHPLDTGAQILIGGQPVELDISAGSKLTIEMSGDALIIHTPSYEREYLRDALRVFLSDMALAAVKSSVSRYAPIVGRSPKAVKLREQRTRWGSCSSAGNINLNWKLVMAPAQVLDYVVVHELCHLFELNHSPAFWRRVRGVMPDYEYWKKWLKDNGRYLNI